LTGTTFDTENCNPKREKQIDIIQV